MWIPLVMHQQNTLCRPSTMAMPLHNGSALMHCNTTKTVQKWPKECDKELKASPGLQTANPNPIEHQWDTPKIESMEALPWIRLNSVWACNGHRTCWGVMLYGTKSLVGGIGSGSFKSCVLSP